MNNIICIFVVVAFSTLTACSAPHPIVVATVITPLSWNEIRTASMGDTVYRHYTCPCTENYKAQSEIAIDGWKTIPKSSVWVAKYRNTDTNEKYLVNDDYHPDLALALKDEKISPSRAIVQFGGVKTHRVWPLVHPLDSESMVFDGYLPNHRWWSLQYIGLDKNDKNVLRFTVDTRFQSEIVGTIEYTHSLSNGNEFVVKGVRIKILEASNDSTITYQVL